MVRLLLGTTLLIGGVLWSAHALVLTPPGLPTGDPLWQPARTTAPVAKIYGKIQFVTSFPDYKVKVVTSFPDLRVQIVNSFPDRPGKWQIVTSFPDYKIQLVDSFPDFSIQYVTSFPGLP
jgi:hypothetical protein